ncbi:Atp-binding protein, partial [Globisporangium splendens]
MTLGWSPKDTKTPAQPHVCPHSRTCGRGTTPKGASHLMEGSIVMNGAKWTKGLKRFASYVMRDDLFYRTITVREHLVYQSRLRMGRTSSVTQCTARVDAALEELGLNKCRDMLVGDATYRGISGGDRKRLSFATEILTNPSLLFIDEPASGLDSLIATIEQLSSELYTLFDTLCLLSEGATVCHGKATHTTDYFTRLGYQCPGFVDPSDCFMQQLVVLDKDKDEEGFKRVQMLKDEWSEHQEQQDNRDVFLEADVAAQAFDHENYQDGRLKTLSQVAVIMSRNAVRLVRDRIAFQTGVFQNLFIAVIVGLVYLQLDVDQKGIQNFAGAFFAIVVNQTFASASSLFVAIPTELPKILREYKTGLYHLVVWYVSKKQSELPLQIFLPSCSVPTYFLIGIGHGAATHISLQILVMLANFAAVGLGYMALCLFHRVDVALIVGNVILLPFMLSGGLFLNADDAPKYLIWIQYISPIKYGFEGLVKVFWRKISSIPCDANANSCVARTGDQVLGVYSMNGASATTDGFILLALGLAFRLIGFVTLWTNAKGK